MWGHRTLLARAVNQDQLRQSIRLLLAESDCNQQSNCTAQRVPDQRKMSEVFRKNQVVDVVYLFFEGVVGITGLRRFAATLEVNQDEFVVLRKRDDEMTPAIYVGAQAMEAKDGVAGAIDLFVQAY